MLLLDLAKVNGLSSLCANLTDPQRAKINQLNRIISDCVFNSRSADYSLASKCLAQLFASGTTSISQQAIDKLVHLYLEKIAQYCESSAILSESHRATADTCHLSSNRPAISHSSNGWSPIDISSMMSDNSANQIRLILSHLRNLEAQGESFPVVNLPHDLGMMREIACLLEQSYAYELHQLLRFPEDFQVTVSGQAKLHPPNVDITSANWHLDGDPRFLKMILYLDDVPDNDGALRFAPWQDNGMYYPMDHLGRCNLMIPYGQKKQILTEYGLKPRDLGIFLISDECFFARRSQIPFQKYHRTTTTYLSGALFHGTVVPHSGGDNRIYYRPALQAFVNVVPCK